MMDCRIDARVGLGSGLTLTSQEEPITFRRWQPSDARRPRLSGSDSTASQPGLTSHSPSYRPDTE